MENNNQIQQNQIDQILAEAGLSWPIETPYSTTNQKSPSPNLNWNSNNDKPPTYQQSTHTNYFSRQPTQPLNSQSPMPISVIRSLNDTSQHHVQKDMSQYLMPHPPEPYPEPPLPENLPHERAEDIVETEPVQEEESIQYEVTENHFEEVVHEEVIMEDTDVIMADEMTYEEVATEEVTTEEVNTEEVTTEEVLTEEVTTEELTTEEVTAGDTTATELTSEDFIESTSVEEGDVLEEANSSLDSSLPGEVQCEFCGNSFPSNDLPSHQESILTEDGSPAFKCQICLMGFDKKCVLELHQSSCVPRSSLDEIEDRISSSEDERKISEDHQEQPVEESVVNIPISFATEEGLQHHRLNKDGSDWLLNGFLSFQCELCGDRFQNNADMNKERFKQKSYIVYNLCNIVYVT